MVEYMKAVSIYGDSISTYKGYNPDGYAVFYDRNTAMRNELYSVEDTWWWNVINSLSANLCVNNSYSGSKVTGMIYPSACCEERLVNLRTKKCVPDIILVYIGFNDWGYGVALKKSRTSGTNENTFEYSYDYMLSRLKDLYPNTVIICATLMRTIIRGNPEWVFPELYRGIAFDDYNNAIRSICQKHRCCLADLNIFDIAYETLDGSHPTKNGHRTIAETWVHCLKNSNLDQPHCFFPL